LGDDRRFHRVPDLTGLDDCTVRLIVPSAPVFPGGYNGQGVQVPPVPAARHVITSLR
jgi:hypothetical protein